MLNKRLRLFAVAVLGFSRSIWGQGSEADSVKGELRLNSPAAIHGEVKLTSLHGAITGAIATEFHSDGRFEFRHVPYGDYRLTVVDGSNRPIHEEMITVHDRPQPIEVDVTVREEPKPASGAVSAQELLHPPTKRAFKASLAAQKLSEAGQHEKAAEQLQKAIQLSPDYAPAWINLGVQHVFLKRYEQALQELAHAMEISHPTPMVLCNMSYVQYTLRRYAEGTQSAREALRLDPSCVQAHYLLGSFLVHDRHNRTEGVQHLEVAAHTMPAAQAELERVRRESAQVVTHP